MSESTRETARRLLGEIEIGPCPHINRTLICAACAEAVVAKLVAERDEARKAVDCGAYANECQRYETEGVPCFRHADATLTARVGELERENEQLKAAIVRISDMAGYTRTKGTP